jgi:hypothetical protein
VIELLAVPFGGVAVAGTGGSSQSASGQLSFDGRLVYESYF